MAFVKTRDAVPKSKPTSKEFNPLKQEQEKIIYTQVYKSLQVLESEEREEKRESRRESGQRRSLWVSQVLKSGEKEEMRVSCRGS